MNIAKQYLKLCFKRFFKGFLPIFATTLVIAAVLLLVLSFILSANNSREVLQKVNIGVVGDVTGTYLDVGFETLQNLDDISLSVDFKQMGLEKAKKQLINGKISGYIVVPDNYLYDMLEGNDTVLELVILKTSSQMSGVLISEVAQMLSPIVTESERGIYSLRDYRKSENIPYSSKISQSLQITYLDAVLNRKDAIDVKISGVQSLSLTQYYVCGIVIFFFLIFPVSCCGIFADKRIALGRLICSKEKYAHIKLVLCEFTAYLASVLLIEIVICAVGEAFCFFVQPKMQIGFISQTAIMFIPCIVMLCAMQFLLYEALENVITGALCQFASACALGYISGCFYPYYFFPQALQKLSALLPSGIAFEFLRQSVSGKACFVLIPCTAYTALFIFASVCIRTYRLRKECL